MGGYLVGFEEEVATLQNQLVDDGIPHQAIFCILGECGIGKNIFLEVIYGLVSDHFGLKIWYNMPPNSSPENLLKEIYHKVLNETADCQQENDIDFSVKLRHLLAKKRYLLILGGLSSKTQLNCVWASLPNDNEGSRILLSLELEHEVIAMHADAINRKWHPETRIVASTIRLNRLDKNKSGELFRSKVFGNKSWEGNLLSKFLKNWQKKLKGQKTEENPWEDKKYDQDVFDITDGHPLAIVVLAGLLKSKEKPSEWETTLEQLKNGWEAPESKGYQITCARPREHTPCKLSNRLSVERIIGTSFDNLPHDLKSCFLYFAAYPNNVCWRVERVVRMWTAEGFIKPHQGKTMEETGWDYVKELISRCLVEVEGSTAYGEIQGVLVHKRILRFLQFEAREACFIEVHNKNDVLAPASVRRLSIQNDSGTYTTFSNIFPKLRSFICRVVDEIQSDSEDSRTNIKNKYKIRSKHDIKFLCGSKFLRVIDIRGLAIQKLPEEIGDMIHLRYICVASRKLENLPSSIGKLRNLQTLEIKKTKVTHVDPKFWKIKTLRHVVAEQLELPSSEINGPEELQTLRGVVLSKEKWDEESYPLKLLNKLRSLELKGVLALPNTGELWKLL